MKVEMMEPKRTRYLYINPENNQVHLMMPLVGGATISTDNTCKAVMALRDFLMGKEGVSALDELQAYEKGLETDLCILAKDTPIYKAKSERLTQTQDYMTALKAFAKKENLSCLTKTFPVYPKSVQKLQEKSQGLHSILLAPTNIDKWTRFSKYEFSLERKKSRSPFGCRRNFPENLEKKLKTCDVKLSNIADELSQAPEVLAVKMPAHKQRKDGKSMSVAFEELKKALVSHLKKNGDQPGYQAAIDSLQRKRKKSDAEPEHNFVYFRDELMVVDDDSSVRELIDMLLKSEAAGLSQNLKGSPLFYSNIDSKNPGPDLSIKIQYMLAKINLYCNAHRLSAEKVDFGKIIEAKKNKSLLQLSLIHI